MNDYLSECISDVKSSFTLKNDTPELSQTSILPLPTLHPSCHGKAEECIGLCRALLGVVVWLLTGCAWYCERLRELGPSASTEASLRACQERLRDLVNSTKNRALVHIARLENQGQSGATESSKGFSYHELCLAAYYFDQTEMTTKYSYCCCSI